MFCADNTGLFIVDSSMMWLVWSRSPMKSSACGDAKDDIAPLASRIDEVVCFDDV